MYGAMIRSIVVLYLFSAFCFDFVQCNFKIKWKNGRVGWVENRSICVQRKRWRKGILKRLWAERKENVSNKKSQERKRRGRRWVVSLKKHRKGEGKRNMEVRDAEKGFLVGKAICEKVWEWWDLWWLSREWVWVRDAQKQCWWLANLRIRKGSGRRGSETPGNSLKAQAGSRQVGCSRELFCSPYFTVKGGRADQSRKRRTTLKKEEADWERPLHKVASVSSWTWFKI